MTKNKTEAMGLKRFSPHDLRRTFVSDMLDAGADIVNVQRLAEHRELVCSECGNVTHSEQTLAPVVHLHLHFDVTIELPEKR